ncbi:hypothetical protein QYF36_024615 [Acer negundo]|nr:hypothetical protein QYF36_024615 [Acer negundo]
MWQSLPFRSPPTLLLSSPIINRLASAAPNTHFLFFNTAESNNSLFSTNKHYFLPNVKAYNVSRMSKVSMKDLPEGVLFGNLQSIFSHMLHQMGLKLPQGEAVVINNFEELDPIINNDLKSKFNQFLNVGPFSLISPPPDVPDTSGCLLWLHRQEPASVAYLGFGSVSRLSPNEIVAVAEALEASKVSFIWPFFGDQRLNARMVQDEWEIGVSVEGEIITKNGLLRSLDLILWQENGKKMRENARKFKQLAEMAIGPRGSSMENFKGINA